jgi:hypothetical protein
LLSQIEYFVRTGTMPFENGNFHPNWVDYLVYVASRCEYECW